MDFSELADMTADEVESQLGLTEEQMADLLCVEIETYRAIKASDAQYHDCPELPDANGLEAGSMYNCSHNTKWSLNELMPGFSIWTVHVEGVPATFEGGRESRREYQRRHNQKD